MITGDGVGALSTVAASLTSVIADGNVTGGKIVTVPAVLVVVIVTVLPVSVRVEITAMFRFLADILAIVR